MPWCSLTHAWFALVAGDSGSWADGGGPAAAGSGSNFVFELEAVYFGNGNACFMMEVWSCHGVAVLKKNPRTAVCVFVCVVIWDSSRKLVCESSRR